MAELVFEEELKFSQDVKSGDEISVGGMHAKVERIDVNSHDDMIFHLEIVGAKFKRRSKMMLILPKKVPVTTLK